MCESAFWRGMAAGVVAGAVTGMMVAEKRNAMKTCVGRTMQQMFSDINPNAIDSSWLLKTVYMPEVETISNNCFSQLCGLEYLDFNKVKTIDQYAFTNCSNLKKLIIRTNEVCSINRRTMSGSPFGNASSEAYIYVPRALVEQYKANQYWSPYADKIRAIGDYPDITGG